MAVLSELYARFTHYLFAERTADAVRALIVLLLSFVFARIAGRWVAHFTAAQPDRSVVLSRIVKWGVLLVGLSSALNELGFSLSVVLGAAGVLTVAIGFAAQTTLSNLISGFFLFGDRPFRIGDVIEVDGVSGEVLSVDMMATTLRTLDNRFVRIPNEMIIKTKLQNFTRFPIRRVDFSIPVAHHEDFGRIRALLLEIIDQSPLCLEEPAPSVFIQSFGELSVQVQVWAWTRTENTQELRATMGPALQEGLGALRRATAATILEDATR